MNLKPLFDRLIVRPQKNDEKTAFGILLPESSGGDIKCGEIAAISNFLDEKKCYVKIGQKILYNKFCAYDIEWQNENYILLKQDDVLAVVE